MTLLQKKNRQSRVRTALGGASILLLAPVLGLTERPGSSQFRSTYLRAERAQVRSSDLRGASDHSAFAEPEVGPQPPCGADPVPPFPRVDEPANVKAWSAFELGADWKPPACTGWTATGFTSLVTIAARFRHPAGADGLLRHVGSISQLGGIRYWSATHQRWQTLIKEAHALTDPQNARARGDFAPEELKQGKAFYFEQVDNLSGKAIYQMRIVEASKDRIVFEIENVTTMKYLLVPVLHPGEMQSIYFFDRESDNVWRYYSVARTGKNANHMMAGNEKSSINRAVAFYRYMVGIPTDQEPPPAR
jgi:hypothetical protein